MSPPDYDANLVPAPSLTREFEAIPGFRMQAFLPVNVCSSFIPHSHHLKLGLFSQKRLKNELKLECGGVGPHPTLPVKASSNDLRFH